MPPRCVRFSRRRGVGRVGRAGRAGGRDRGLRLGVEARHFCYPKALEPSAAADAEVRRRFDSAVLAGTRANTVGADPYRLARSPVQRSDGRRSFEAKAHGGLGTEDRIRVMLNRRRYRGATV